MLPVRSNRSDRLRDLRKTVIQPDLRIWVRPCGHLDVMIREERGTGDISLVRMQGIVECCRCLPHARLFNEVCGRE